MGGVKLIKLKPGQMAIERDGSQVIITIACQDNYAAMLMRDEIGAQACAGGFVLRLKTERVAS